MSAPRWKNGVGKRCDCPDRPRCDCLYWIRVQHLKERVFRPVTKFVFLLEKHQSLPTTRADVEALAARVYDWLVRGKPIAAPVVTTAVERTGNDLIDGWLKWQSAKHHGRSLQVQQSNASFVKRSRASFGALTMSQLVVPGVFQSFVDEQLARGRKIATPNRILGAVVRPAIRWGLAQEPPWLTKNPFGEHRFNLDTKAEDRRTERCAPEREANILAAVAKCQESWSEGLADYIVMGIDLGARSDELLGLTNADVDWHASTVTFRRTKRGEVRIVPFNPKGRVAAILKRRRFAGPTAKIIASKKLFKPWVHAICIAYELPYAFKKRGGYLADETIAAYKSMNIRLHDLRHEAATWWGICGVSDEDCEFLQGHKSQRMHGRYSHEKLARAKAALAEKVWPREHERAKLQRSKAKRA